MMVVSISGRFDVESLRQQHPIAEVVRQCGIQLVPKGRALVGRCPFHADGGRPNLHVYPETQSWYCFRCAVGGDVIDFIRRRENLGFAEACRRLTGSRSMPSSLAHSPRQPVRERRWDQLTLEEQVVMNVACAIYQESLWKEPRALDYLRIRGIQDQVIQECALGFADGYSLERHLRRQSRLAAAQDLGLLGEHRQGNGRASPRDFLAGRIVVPELRGGHCLWFIGRKLDEASVGPRYLALPGERPVLGLERVVGRKEVFLCEGVFDYLTAVAWKLSSFSPCGTHLPGQRLGFLARAEAIYGLLDGDEAGREATERFGRQLGERWRPVRLPEGTDLNDLGRRPEGRVEFLRLLEAAHQASTREVPDGR